MLGAWGRMKEIKIEVEIEEEDARGMGKDEG